MFSQMNVRPASREDIDSIIEQDPIAKHELGRRVFIADAVAAGQCWVAVEAMGASALIGYGVLNKSFFENNFVPLIVVKVSARRRGVATAIMTALESQCAGKLFTSTNTSNIAMRQLLKRLGFVESGWIENLDDNDPELVFVKRKPAPAPKR
ncbi:GNAT family N-acetyltransferase [Achromobacter sp. MYb9]|jgi:GNAT superfamily N-acetyltransferase|nr:GNAT family N-acetyltransferase [Achromobacter sp. MYb9]